MEDNYIFNTGETNTELHNKYNSDNTILRKAQLRMLDMLLYIDRICKENNINYSLDSGNVLGAVRHGGFIPWDDDVDIILERKEYKRLCKYLLSHPHPQYKLQTPQTDKWFMNHWNVLRDIKSEYIQDSVKHNLRKYRGLQIDIFPIENRVSPFGHKLVYYLHHNNQKLFMGKNNHLCKLFFYVIACIIIPFIRIVFSPFQNKNTYSYGYGLPWTDKKWISNVLFPYKNILFEGHYFPGPSNLDSYLKTQYNNYMDLPPINERNHHQATYKIFD